MKEKWFALILLLLLLVGCNNNVDIQDDVTNVASYTYVPVENKVASYIYQEGKTSQDLEDELGDVYVELGEFYKVKREENETDISYQNRCNLWDGVENCTWYKLKDIDNVEYLIRESSDELTLWKFDVFFVNGTSADNVRDAFPEAELDSYTYGEEIFYVYNVDSAEDIKSITVKSASHTDLEKLNSITNEIETFEIVEREKIEYLYDVFSEMICNGYDEMITNYRTAEMQEKIESDQDNVFLYLRELEIHLEDGNSINGLTYSSAAGAFYKYVNYKPVEEDTALRIDKIFQIN